VELSVREWKFDNREMKDFYKMIHSFCEVILKKGYAIEFISTCQGVENYRNDSQVANIISDQLIQKQSSYSSQIMVNSTYQTDYELIELLNTKYAFTIGTRLHMCILSLINGIPAFNISYEVKGIECYRYLGLEGYSADFNESEEKALEKFDNFLKNHKSIQASLLDRILPIHEESKESLKMFIKEMGI
jgi:polysaccharide pyruvyl transferase WcaK-like protein